MYLAPFRKDLEKLRDSELRAQVHELIRIAEAAESPRQIPGIKKLRGRTSHYRIRIGEYRVGVIYRIELRDVCSVSQSRGHLQAFPMSQARHDFP